jgi:hypothetical protein
MFEQLKEVKKIELNQGVLQNSFPKVETLSFYAMVKRLNLCDEIIDERNKRSFI